jgi:uncharacterized protein
MVLAQTPPELRARVTPLLATPWPWVALVGGVVLPSALLWRGNLGRSGKTR